MKGFIELTRYNQRWLVAVSAIASVREYDPNQTIITLISTDSNGKSDEAFVSFPFDSVLRMIKNAL